LFKRVLIANRGEIAIRVARAASALGVASVTVYTAADALSLHIRVTTESREIGSSRGPSSDPVRAYLDIEALIEAAKATRCDSVHPGYGFLSENTTFAKRCLEEGIAFIGPRPETLALFGDKTKARDLARSLDIPIIPGSSKALASVEDALAISKTIGYPVMLKAAGGGGGRGMRVVASADEMSAAFARCRSEALAAFGDDSVFVEKLVARPRHIEVQVLADSPVRKVTSEKVLELVDLRPKDVVQARLDGGIQRWEFFSALKAESPNTSFGQQPSRLVHPARTEPESELPCLAG
jgi:pyruvate carboxylase